MVKYHYDDKTSIAPFSLSENTPEVKMSLLQSGDEAKVKEIVWNIFYKSPFYDKDCSNEQVRNEYITE